MLLGLGALLTALPALAAQSPGEVPAATAATPAPAEEKAAPEEKTAGEPGRFEAYDLGELVVTGEGAASQAVSITTTMTAEEIAATNSETAAEALAHAPGVVVTTNRRNESLVQIYGLPQSRALVLIDGVPYYETKYHTLNLDQIPATLIARIEVIKGAPSVLYGANALAGVINIVTKKAGKVAALELNGEAGLHDTYRFSASHGMQVDKLDYWVNYTHRESAGYPMSADYQPTLGTVTQRPGGTYQAVFQDDEYRNNSDYYSNTLWSRLGWTPNPDGEYYVNLHLLDSSRGMAPDTNSVRVFPNDPAFSNFSRWGKYKDLGADLSGRQKIGDRLTLAGKLFYHDHEDDFESYLNYTYGQLIAISTYQDYFVGGNLTADYELAQGHNLGAAIHYKGDSHKERDDVYLPYAETFSYTGSAGLEYRFTAITGLNVVTGASYDWYQVDQAQENILNGDGQLDYQEDLETPGVSDDFNPMLGASYQFVDTTRLFASVAKKTRFPTLMELYSTKGGNRDLNAEQSVNYTLGVGRNFLGDTLYGEVSGFFMDITDWISKDTPDWDSKYRNYGKITLAGVEVIATWKPLADLSFRFDYTYTKAKDESDGAVTEDVVGVPEHKLDLLASYLVPYLKTKLDFTALLVGETYNQVPTPLYPDQEELKTDSYLVFNARISRVFFTNYEVYFAVNNLFDKDYETERYFPAPGRNLWVGLTARF
ncbi:MAG: TonB-dependent receptor [Deltaproteobacteria bacterium]|nr:TonB-dependent receptor [Deltaproteobacteria bacterium]